MTCDSFYMMPTWWSWSAFSGIGTMLAVFVALFGEKIKCYLFRPKIEIREFGTVVERFRADLSENVSYEHYIEIFHSGSPLLHARFEVLEMVSNPNNQKSSRSFFPPALAFPMQYGSTIHTREVIKVFEAKSHFELPTFPIELGEHPWLNISDDPHYRGRFYIHVIGENFCSDIWPIDVVKDSNISSGWRLEVLSSEPRKSFFQRRRNYIRDFNEKKRSKGLP
jgi:hypothetical protein